MQGWKREVVVMKQKRWTAASESNSAPRCDGTFTGSAATSASNTAPDAVADVSPWDSILSDDVLADWDNRPSFDAFDFSDLFADAFTCDAERRALGGK